MIRLIGYVRVSSESQKENTSLGVQEEKIRAYCLAMGYQLVNVFKDVQSGKNSHRTGLTQAIEALGEADGLIVAKLDRLGRNALDLLKIHREVLYPLGKELISLDINIDTATPTGRLLLTMLGAIGEMEREQINERTQSGRNSKRARGGYIGGAPKFGLKALDRELLEDESELAVIEVIRRHYKAGKSFNAIAKYLNKQGIPAKRGGVWSATTVGRVIRRIYPKSAIIRISVKSK